MNYFKKALSFLLTFLLLSQHSFSMENDKEDRSHTIKLFEKHHKENPELLNSSKEKDIVVFLGNTRSGKSTLINYLSDKELKVTEYDDIVLSNPLDREAMAIGVGGDSETFLPQRIQHKNLLFYDLPGFGDTRGTAKNLINACFIKNIIENAKTARLVFVAGYDEITAKGGEFFKELLVITEKLIPNEKIEDFSSLVITKTKPEIDNPKFIEGLKIKVKSELIAPWINKESLTQMSSPLNKEINQTDKENITNIILKTSNKKINNINISAIYDEKEKSNIKKIYDEKIEDITDLFIKEKISINNLSSLDGNDLEIKKQYFQNDIRNDIKLSIEESPLIALLSPVSEEIYLSSLNDAKKNIFIKISIIEGKIDLEIKEQEKKKAELEKKQLEEKLHQEETLREEQENKRIQEENRRKQVEEQLRLEQEKLRLQQIESQRQQEIIRQQNLEYQRLQEQRSTQEKQKVMKKIQKLDKLDEDYILHTTYWAWHLKESCISETYFSHEDNKEHSHAVMIEGNKKFIQENRSEYNKICKEAERLGLMNIQEKKKRQIPILKKILEVLDDVYNQFIKNKKWHEERFNEITFVAKNKIYKHSDSISWYNRFIQENREEYKRIMEEMN